MYNARLGKFFSIDNYSSKFPSFTPYLFAGNTPIAGIDINGDSLYILAYTTGNHDPGDDAMFKASALTRKYDIEHTSGFDPLRDKVVLLEVTDMGKLEEKVEKTQTTHSKTFGKTVEFGIWSHSGYDGPTGTEETSKYPLSEDSYQMSPKGWGEIDFNWEDNGNSRAGFYGCNSGEGFTTDLSSMSNYLNVNVSGQKGRSFPSLYTNERNTTPQRNYGRTFLPVNGKNKTYMVGGNEGQGLGATLYGIPALPMRTSKNGINKTDSYQSGDKK
jgi:hypothetical protein